MKRKIVKPFWKAFLIDRTKKKVLSTNIVNHLNIQNFEFKMCDLFLFS